MKRKTPAKANAPNAKPDLQPQTQLVLPNNEEWLNTAEIMSYFRVSERTLLRWRKTRQIPSSKVGGTVLYPLNLVNKLLINRIEHNFIDTD
ncbi:MAG: helix-turn-helix domain-containing protein [Gelidibacter sp.]